MSYATTFALSEAFFLDGDYNLNVINPDQYARKLNRSIEYLNLIQIVEESTRDHNLIDLCIPEQNTKAETEVLELAISDHRFVKISYPITNKVKQKRLFCLGKN